MSLVARSLLTGAVLLGSAHAAGGNVEPGATGPQAGKDIHKVAAVQAAPSAGKKTGPAQGIEAKPVAQPDAGKTKPAVQESQDGATADPSGADEQTVQLGGVRG